MDGTDLARELQEMRSELVLHFQNGNWQELARALDTLARVSELRGQKELCLRSQSLRELMGIRSGGGRERAGQRLSELFHDLMFHLAHFQWKTTI